ncbi:MAG TPA: glycosyltransferase [Candidatus Woesearchaeota archaeon]|nr:glycosyltransferase [Candidatus Woesearchaeota archaeon]
MRQQDIEASPAFAKLVNNTTIIIPAYNEERRVGLMINKLNKFVNKFHFRPRLIFVLDGCSDKTKEKLVYQLNNLKEKAISEIIEYKQNKGVGYALSRGLYLVKTKYVLFSDFDFSTPLEEMIKFEKYYEKYDVLVGSRWSDKAFYKNNIIRRILSWASSFLIRKSLEINVKDTQCGFMLFKSQAAKEVYSKRTINRFGSYFEVIAIASLKGKKIKEIGVVWKHEKGSKVRVSDFIDSMRSLRQIKKNIRRGVYG